MHIKSEISVFLIKRKKTLQVSHAKEMTIKKKERYAFIPSLKNVHTLKWT